MKVIAKKNGKLSKILLGDVEGLSYSVFNKLLRKKDIKINGTRVSCDVSVSVGDEIDVFFVVPEKDKYDLLYLDDNVIVINKYSGYTSESVFVNLQRKIADARFIHRLDRNTSGIMIFAKNEYAESELLKAFKNHSFEKYYTAVVKGISKEDRKIMTAYLLKDADNSLVKIFDKEVKGSVKIKTEYEIIKKDGDVSTLKVRLYTGKTHQIRAHLAHIGLPILGDGKYGDNDFNKLHNCKTQQLSATELVLHFNKDSILNYLEGKTFKI